MISDYKEYNAGLIYVMAKALQRHSPDHVTIWQAVTWLREQRFEHEADALEASNQSTLKRV